MNKALDILAVVIVLLVWLLLMYVWPVNVGAVTITLAAVWAVTWITMRVLP